MSDETETARLYALMETLVENHKRSLNALELSATRYDVISRDVGRVGVDVKRVDSRFDTLGNRMSKLEATLADYAEDVKAMRQDMATIQSELLTIMHRALSITNNSRLASQGGGLEQDERRYGS